MTPAYDVLRDAGAHFGATWGLEVPQFYAPGQPDFHEVPSLHRSNAFGLVADEVAAVRTAVGAYETGVYSRYEITGPRAYDWLNHLLSSRIPAVGRVRLSPMVHTKGTLMGDLSVTRLADDRFWLVGSYYLQEWHQRWFEQHLPESGVRIDNISDRWLGFAISGPNSRELLSRLTDADVSDAAMPFMTCHTIAMGDVQAVVTRLSFTGELGFEITVPSSRQRGLWQSLAAVGGDLGLLPVGDRAIDSLRLEKAYGIWSTEFTQGYTPGMSGLARFIDWDKGDFIGREAALHEHESGPDRRLVLLDVDTNNADATGDEPVWSGDTLVGLVTSGSYGHHVGRSLALAYVDSSVIDAGSPLSVSIIGDLCDATILPEVPYDPSGSRMRG